MVVTFLLAYKALHNKIFGLHKLEYLKEHGFVAKKDVFHDGSTIIRRTLAEQVQRKIHNAKYSVKIDLLKNALHERQTHCDTKFKDTQEAPEEYFAEAQTMHGRWAQGGVLASFDFAAQRGQVVQCITRATSDLTTSHLLRCKKWNELQMKKKCEIEIRINKQTILRESSDGEAEREKDLSDQLSDIHLLWQHLKLPRASNSKTKG